MNGFQYKSENACFREFHVSASNQNRGSFSILQNVIVDSIACNEMRSCFVNTVQKVTNKIYYVKGDKKEDYSKPCL